jgi:hypothetical protein
VAEFGEDENAMDWTPTDPRAAAASRKHKNATKQSEDIWLRPQTFFPPEKPTGLESLFARTTLQDDAMIVDGPEDDSAIGSSIPAKMVGHLRKWWWIYATVVVPVVVGVLVRRVWHLEITITSVENVGVFVASPSPSPSLEAGPSASASIDEPLYSVLVF